MSGRLRALVCPGGSTHGEVSPGATGILRKRCRDRRCQTGDGSAVYHDFDLAKAAFKETVVVPAMKAARGNKQSA